MIRIHVSETAVVLLIAIALYAAFCVTDWAIDKAKAFFRKEHHK